MYGTIWPEMLSASSNIMWTSLPTETLCLILRRKPWKVSANTLSNGMSKLARVKPSMDEAEMVAVFLQAQEVDYLQNMMSAMDKSFVEAIKIGEMVENGLKTGRIMSHAAFKATSQAAQNGSEGLMTRNEREEGAMMASSSRGVRRSFSQSYVLPKVPPYYYPLQDAAYVMAPPPYAVMNAQPYMRPHHYTQNRALPPRNAHPYQAPKNPQPNVPPVQSSPKRAFQKESVHPYW
nr:uncharacterized protein LOC117280853 [Nicotiana tomentosiformis]XP_033516501.1 uncharacterized protein LOC117280853 [Nicotiana tomentosiformis]